MGLEAKTVDEFLNERGLQNEGTDEDSECAWRREGGMGYGGTGNGENRCVQVRGITAHWEHTYSPIAWWQRREEAARVRPERGEDCDDPPDAGRIVPIGEYARVLGYNNPIITVDEAAFPGLGSLYTDRWTGLVNGTINWSASFGEWMGRALSSVDAASSTEAQNRAETLLLEHLNEEQTKQWERDNYFVVSLPGGNEYTINRFYAAVERKDGKEFCLEPECYGSIPHYDVCLAKKLLLEADEEWFLETANDITNYEEP